jgi:hypothetical protein
MALGSSEPVHHDLLRKATVAGGAAMLGAGREDD